MSQCTEPFVGKILASWRYDISGLAPEMSGDYEAHLEHCDHCRSRQKLHRTVDVALIALATLGGFASVVVFGVIRHFHWQHALWFEVGTLGLAGLSALVWLAVAIATPAPIVVGKAVKGAAITAASNIHDRLPENVRERIPEGVRARISGENQS